MFSVGLTDVVGIGDNVKQPTPTAKDKKARNTPHMIQDEPA
jgi:hypothetical protein